MFVHTPLLASTNTQDLSTDPHSVLEPRTGHYNFSLRIMVELQSTHKPLDLT